MRRSFSLAIAAVFLSGCGFSVSYTKTNASPRRLAPRQPSTVEVLTVAPPERPFVEVGLFEIEQESPQSGDSAEMLEKLREEAATVGCDALVITGHTQRVQSASSDHHGTVSGSRGSGSANYRGSSQHHINTVRGQRAACIVYKDGETTSTTAAPL